MDKYYHFIEEMFDDLVKAAMELLPDFGSTLAIDGKALHSFANRCSDKRADGRRDTDGNWAVKAYKGVNADGTLWEKTISWFATAFI